MNRTEGQPRFKRLAARLCGLLVAAALGMASYADTLDDIRGRGKVVIGVKKDVRLWGYQDSKSGEFAGLEVDLARDLAARLGVRLELVGLLTAERLQAVEQRKVDVMIATLSDTPERRERLTLVRPHYYASGVNLLARKNEDFRKWADLRNRRICGRRGAFYNRAVTVAYGADIVALYSNELAKAALRDGRCSAFLYDDTAILAMLQDPQWGRDFEMSLPTLYPTPWAIALNREDQGSRLEAEVSRAIVNWHRDGTLLAAELRWGIPASPFVREMNQRWSRRDGMRWHCGERYGADTPKDCQ